MNLNCYICHKEITSRDLTIVLKNLKLEKYAQSLESAGVKDLETFCKLDDTQLKEKIGVHLIGPRRKMTSAIEKIRVTTYYSDQ